MPALRVLLVDDEPMARAKLARLLASQADISVVGEASNGTEAVERVAALAPDLIFLDIRMPLLDGFETMAAISARGEQAPKVVFTTAFDEYAVRAFQVRALDYLLKPFDRERLIAALDRVRAQVELEHRPTPPTVRSMRDHLATATSDEASLDAAANGSPERICIRSTGRVQFVAMSDVEWIEAYGNYVRLHTANAHPLLRETLRSLDLRLDPARFCRVHRSAIVNLAAVREMRPCASGDYILHLASGARLRLSRTYRPELDRRMGRRA